MKKVIILSSLALLLLSSSANAHRWEHKEHKHNVKKMIDRPHKRHPHRPYKSHIHRPHHKIANHRRPGYRVKQLHRDSFHFVLGGLSYHYLSGAFYRPYNNGYRVVRAPIGAFIYNLPYGYTKIHINNRNYYRYENIYYERDFDRRGYRVIDAPTYISDASNNYDTSYRYQVGDVALNLPSGAIEVIIDGIHYYEAEGKYFLPSRQNGKTVYTVVDLKY